MWNTFFGAPAPPPLQIAALEFLRGEYGAALDAARQAPPSVSGLLLEARVQMRMRRLSDVLETVRRLRALGADETSSDLATAHEAVALAGLRRNDEAREALARVTIPPHHDRSTNDEVSYLCAMCAWMLGDYGRSIDMIDAVAQSDSADMRARADLMRGWAYAAQSDHEKQFESTVSALQTLQKPDARDSGLLAQTLRVASALARDRAQTLALGDLEQLERTIPWTSWMARDRFQVIRTLAWAHAMQGDYIRAIRELSRAKVIAPDPHAQMLSHLDHAWIASISGEPLHMHAELLEADACADRIEWEQTSDEEIGALMLAAELYAAVDVDAASRYIERAREQRAHIAPWMGFAHDRRFDAFFLYAEACVRFAQGERSAAVKRAREAYDIFASVSYAWRAASAALLLYRLGEGESWLNPVAIVAQRYPRSFLAAELEKLRAHGISPLDRLTPRQREITDAIRRGLRTDAIARELRMAPNTVRVHKNKIFKAFGVASEFELLGRLQEGVA